MPRRKNERNRSMKNLLTQWELKRKNKRCARLPSPKGYAEEELKTVAAFNLLALPSN